MTRQTTFSPCRNYRYALWREWIGGDGYAACRWERCRELATLEDVERFAAQVGAGDAGGAQ